MLITAKSKYIGISPEKLRLVARAIKKNFSAEKSLIYLDQIPQKSGMPLAKTIRQAIANAVNNTKQKSEGLKIKRIQIDEGPFLKRFKPVSRGTAHSIKRRTSHITVILEAGSGKLEVGNKKLEVRSEKQEPKKGKK